MHVARQHAIDNVPYFETLLGAKVIHQTYMVEAENDFLDACDRFLIQF